MRSAGRRGGARSSAARRRGRRRVYVVEYNPGIPLKNGYARVQTAHHSKRLARRAAERGRAKGQTTHVWRWR